MAETLYGLIILNVYYSSGEFVYVLRNGVRNIENSQDDIFLLSTSASLFLSCLAIQYLLSIDPWIRKPVFPMAFQFSYCPELNCESLLPF